MDERPCGRIGCEASGCPHEILGGTSFLCEADMAELRAYGKSAQWSSSTLTARQRIEHFLGTPRGMFLSAEDRAAADAREFARLTEPGPAPGNAEKWAYAPGVTPQDIEDALAWVRANDSSSPVPVVAERIMRERTATPPGR